MSTAEIYEVGDGQVVKLPAEFHIDEDMVSVRREGSAIILEPMKEAEAVPDTWPEGFFEAIHIDDPAFVRPEHGEVPPAPQF